MISKPVTPTPTQTGPKLVPVNGSPSLSSAQIKLIEATERYQEPLVICLYGGPGAGKSRFGGTAPGDIGLIPTERKTRQPLLRSAEEFGKKVIVPEVDLIRSGNPMLLATLPDTCIPPQNTPANVVWTPPIVQAKLQEISDRITLDGKQPACCKRHYYRWHVNRVKSVAFRMAEMPNIKTIVIDTFGQFCEDVQYANYGTSGKIDAKEFGFAPRSDMNTEIVAFLNAINHKNLILTHHAKEVWENNKPVNGKYKPETGFYSIGHFISVMIRMIRDDRVREGDGRYQIFVEDCTANASLIGQTVLYDDGIAFANLGQLVYEESQPEDWE